METIGYGFLLGVGILLAVLAFAAVCALVALASMFISYVKGKGGNGPENGTRERE